jgi:hypothetical protein
MPNSVDDLPLCWPVGVAPMPTIATLSSRTPPRDECRLCELVVQKMHDLDRVVLRLLDQRVIALFGRNADQLDVSVGVGWSYDRLLPVYPLVGQGALAGAGKLERACPVQRDEVAQDGIRFPENESRSLSTGTRLFGFMATK